LLLGWHLLWLLVMLRDMTSSRLREALQGLLPARL
jgi:hypothetical protein